LYDSVRKARFFTDDLLYENYTFDATPKAFGSVNDTRNMKKKANEKAFPNGKASS
jgi:hypothetical protein